MIHIKNIKEHWLILFILLIGVAFRFIPITNYQFSHDELSGLSRTIFPTFSQEINYGVKILDTHPSLIQLFLWVWVNWFGYSEIAIKIPFLLCGILSVWYIYKIGKTFFDESVGLVAATVLSLSFIFIVYSSYARMYISGVLFSILFLHFIFSILFSENPKTKDYLFFVLFALLCGYNHHMSCLFALSVSVIALFYIKKQRLKPYLLSCFVVLICYLPHISVTLYQFSIGGVGENNGGWLSTPRINELYYFILALFGCGISGKIIFALLMLILIASVFKLTPINKKQVFLFWVFLLNYLVIHLYSVFRNPILQFSVLLFCGIALILFMSSFVSILTKKQVAVFSCLISSLLIIQLLYKKHIFSKVHIQDFEQQVITFLKTQQQFGKNNVKAIYGAEPFFVYVYEKKYHKKINYISVRDSLYNEESKLKQQIKNLKEPYVVIGGVSPAGIQAIKEYYPYLVSHTESYFTNITILSKKKQTNYDVSVLETKNLLNGNLNVFVNRNKQLSFLHDSIQFVLNSKDEEFPLNTSLDLKSSAVKKNHYLVAELSFKNDSIQQLNKDKLCLSVSLPNEKSVFFKSVELSACYDSTKKINTAYLEFFAGTNYELWQKQNKLINFFIWKNKPSHYTIVNFKIKHIDYNPTKWTLWN